MATSKIEACKVIDPKGNCSIELKERTIDNPGKGNCGFYAFAIGLIDIIQEERVYNRTVMFDRWVSLDSSLKQYYKDICNYDFDKPNKDLLEALQRILRLITFNIQLEELRQACADAKKKDEYRTLVATSSYRKFAELYYGIDVDPRFNEFSKSPAIKSAIAKIDRAKVIAEHEALVLAPLFMSLVYGEGIDPETITLTTEPSPTAPIIKALNGITEDFVWASHLELDYLANAFKVNLHTLENGAIRYPFQDLPDQHTITVNNQSNIHWTTKVTIAKALKTADPKQNTDPLSHGIVAQDFKDQKASKVERTSPVKTEPKKKEDKGLKKVPVQDKEATEKRVSKKPNTSKHPINKKQASTKNEDIPLNYLGSDADQKKLDRLIRTVNRAVIAYCNYSDSIWFSIFHRHGESGRVRARKFNGAFSSAGSYAEAREMILNFLKDNKNGNTYPHSFRTMLMQELLDAQLKKRIDLNVISKKFDVALAKFERHLPPAETANKPGAAYI